MSFTISVLTTETGSPSVANVSCRAGPSHGMPISECWAQDHLDPDVGILPKAVSDIASDLIAIRFTSDND
jgi:hypothetical protein